MADAVSTQILSAVESLLIEYGKSFPSPVKVKVRRDSDKNPKYTKADPLPLLVVTMNDDQRVEEATARRVFVNYVVTVDWMQTEKPGDRDEDKKLRKILEDIRHTLHIIRIGPVRDFTWRKCMNDVFVAEDKPYTIPLDAQTVNVSPQKFTYQTYEERNFRPGV